MSGPEAGGSSSAIRQARGKLHALAARRSFSYESFDDFANARHLADGVHRIALPEGGTLPLLALGKPLEWGESQRIPVFFNGAVRRRIEGKPPYFVGRGLWMTGITEGIIALSDPLFEVDNSLNVGWYTGRPAWRAQDHIARVLDLLRERSGKDLLCIGVSGGGFAALEAASRLEAAAFVWNPQTCITRYSERFVKPWLAAAFPDKSVDTPENWTIERTKEKGKVVRTQLLDSSPLTYDVTTRPLPASLLYLQNDTDWHVAQHLRFYVEGRGFVHEEPGVFSDGARHVVALGHWGSGHARPPRGAMMAGINAMLPREADPREVLRGLAWTDGTPPDLSRLPSSLVPEEFREYAD